MVRKNGQYFFCISSYFSLHYHLPDCITNCFIRRVFGKSNSQVYNGNVGCRYPECHSSKFSIQVWNYLAKEYTPLKSIIQRHIQCIKMFHIHYQPYLSYSLCSTCCCRDNVLGSSSTISPSLV